MCLILLAWKCRDDLPLVVAANRDEDFARPTAPADFWQENPESLAGRDLSAGGTWLGTHRNGRFAAITNYRNPSDRRSDAPSRGALVANFLRDTTSPPDYLRSLQASAQAYNGYSLLVGDRDQLWCFSNRGLAPQALPPGVHGLSNHLLNTPWPKVTRGVSALETLVRRGADSMEYFDLLDDTTVATDPELPDTGVGIERERWLSAMRLVGASYGTRCSTVLRMSATGEAEFHERTWGMGSEAAGTVSHRFRIVSARA